jgi:hypothetical protein
MTDEYNNSSQVKLVMIHNTKVYVKHNGWKYKHVLKDFKEHDSQYQIALYV